MATLGCGRPSCLFGSLVPWFLVFLTMPFEARGGSSEAQLHRVCIAELTWTTPIDIVASVSPGENIWCNHHHHQRIGCIRGFGVKIKVAAPHNARARANTPGGYHTIANDSQISMIYIT
jgi:hypothetical protein